MDIKQFRVKLRSARQEKGLSQRGLGLALGLSDKTISSYESGRSYPNLEILGRISDILGKPVEYFISSSKQIKISELINKIESNQDKISEDISKIVDLVNREE